MINAIKARIQARDSVRIAVETETPENKGIPVADRMSATDINYLMTALGHHQLANFK